MLRSIKCAIAATFLAGVSVYSADLNAATIVDTGTPTGDPVWGFVENQYFAGEFTLSDTTSLTSVEAYLRPGTTTSGSVDVQIWDDGGNTPGTSLYSSNVSIAAGSPLDWYGANGLNWVLGPGTYWAAFVPVGGFAGSMPGTAPRPLAEYAQGGGGTWSDCGPDCRDNLAIGMRIEGTVVPLPAALPLLLSALGVFGFMGWRRRKAAA